MSCILTNFEISNYKSIKKVSIEPNESLSTIIGKNGSGKTVFVTSLLLLKKLSSYRNTKNINDFKDKFSVSKTGKPSSLSATFKIDKSVFTYNVKFYEIEPDGYSDVDIIIETETVNVKHGRKKKSYDISLAFILSMESRADQWHHQRNFIQFSSRSGDEPFKFYKKVEELSAFIDVFKAVKNFINGIKYYSATKFANPSACPSSIEYDEKGNLSSSYYGTPIDHRKFISDIYQAKIKDPELFNQFITIIKDSALGLIDSIEHKEIDLPSYSVKVKQGGQVVKSENQRKIVVTIFKKGDFELLPSNLSEGTFKSIAIIFYLLSDPNSVLVIEEPEVCIHHGLLTRIIDIIKSYSTEKQIFLTTHSEVVLDLVEADSVFVMLWSNGSKISKLKNFLGRKGTSGLKKYLSEEGNLGEYLKHKDIFND